MDLLAQHLQARLGLSLTDEEKEEPVLEEFTLAGIAKYITSNECKAYFMLNAFKFVLAQFSISYLRSPQKLSSQIIQILGSFILGEEIITKTFGI